jgi:hypothetical protein
MRITQQKAFESQETFVELYNSYYPDKKKVSLSDFHINDLGSFYRYDALLTWYYFMVDGHMDNRDDIICFWLFYDFPVEEMRKNLFTISLTHGLKSLTVSDYALAIHISLQDDKTQAFLQGLSLPLLHDMFDPVAEEKYQDWLRIQDVNS